MAKWNGAFEATGGGRGRFRQGVGAHVANAGASREVTIRGVPEGEYRVVRTSETDAFRELERMRPRDGLVKLNLPERASVTLFR